MEVVIDYQCIGYNVLGTQLSSVVYWKHRYVGTVLSMIGRHILCMNQMYSMSNWPPLSPYCCYLCHTFSILSHITPVEVQLPRLVVLMPERDLDLFWSALQDCNYVCADAGVEMLSK